jgi:hypothetical protein
MGYTVIESFRNPIEVNEYRPAIIIKRRKCARCGKFEHEE